MLDYNLLEKTCDNLITLKAYMEMAVQERHDIYVDEERVLVPVDDAIDVMNELEKETGLKIYRFFGGALRDLRGLLREAKIDGKNGAFSVSSDIVELLDSVYELLEKNANKEREKRGLAHK